MSHNRDLSAAAGQFGFHSSNIGIGSEAPRYALDVYNSNLLVSGPSAGNIILEDRGVGDSSRPFHVVSSDGGKFVINRSNRNASGTTTSSVNSLTLNSSGNLGLGQQTSPAANIHIGDISSGYELKVTGNAVQFNRSSNSYIDQLHDSGNILFRMTSSNTEAMRITSGGNIGIGVNPTNVLDVEGTTHSKILIGTTGTGHATGLQITHAKGNAAEQMWQLQTDGSSDGNLKIRNATSSTDVMFFDADNNNVGVNITNPERKLEVVDTAGSLTFPVAVSNHTDASAGVGAGIAFHLTAGGNARGDFGVVYAGNSNSDGTDFVFRPNDGSTGQVERLRIKGSNGNMGLGVSPSYSGVFGGNQRVLHIGGTTAPGLRIQSSTSNQGDFIIQAGNSGGATYLSNLSNNANTAFYMKSGGSLAERFRITHDGYVLKSDTPAFQCKLSTATSSTFNGFLIFNSVRYNIGNHYNSSNGRFTAPVDGRYLFSWYTNMLRDGGTGSLWADWYVNGGAQGNRMYTHYSGAWELIGGTIIMDLNSSDYVQVYTGQPGRWDGGSYGAFSGYLLG